MPIKLCYTYHLIELIAIDNHYKIKNDQKEMRLSSQLFFHATILVMSRLGTCSSHM